MFLVPSLSPIRLRGVSCSRVVVEVRPKPSCDHFSTTDPRPIRARLRTAWKATCGSSEHACTQRSPPEIAGSIASAGNGPNWRSDAGRCRARPNRSTPSRSNSPGPKPKVIVSRLGRWPIASPVSSGGSNGSSLRGPAGSPAVIRAAASVQARSTSTSSARLVVVTSKAAK